MKLRRRRTDPWGTWCRTCRTVRLRGTSIACIAAPGVLPHPITIVEVIP